jgi:hypothetical protein
MNDANNLEMQIRLTALQLAVTAMKDMDVEYSDQIVRTARNFADFLRGSDIPEEIAI